MDVNNLSPDFKSPTDRRSIQTGSDLKSIYNNGTGSIFTNLAMPSPVAGKAPKLDTQIKDGVDFFGKGRGNARVGKGVQETQVNVAGQGKRSTEKAADYNFGGFNTFMTRADDLQSGNLNGNQDKSWFTKGLGGNPAKYGDNIDAVSSRGNNNTGATRKDGKRKS